MHAGSGCRAARQVFEPMDEITLKDYRCFHEEQTARLAPLTLLVGDNSTGKTSFLAMIRALWDVAYGHEVPDFKEDPYDLGSFDEIAHHRGGRAGRAETFEAGFCDFNLELADDLTSVSPYRLEVTFGKKGTNPVPVRRRESFGSFWIEDIADIERSHNVLRIGTIKGSWELALSSTFAPFDGRFMVPFDEYLRSFLSRYDPTEDTPIRPLGSSPPLDPEDRHRLRELFLFLRRFPRQEPFASAPVRSKPFRTYDPGLTISDSGGDYVPMYLANALDEGTSTWSSLKIRLESFGKSAGLFDEISIRRLGKKGSDPFQVQVRKFESGLKGPWRNLIDVGYGVSQVLPVITELLRPDAPRIFLFQQPEVHLHPSAQAALGSLFCEVASSGQQLVVETHSDHLIDRVRMEVRDGRTDLKPEEVSILFFERDGLEVNIHSIRIDEDGNINGQPNSYRRFFMEEIRRSLGF